MSGTKISKLVLGVVLLLVLGTLVIVTTSRGDLVGLAAEVVATPAPSPTPTRLLTWENATLDQIRFGEPKVVLTDTLGLRIVGWISNAEVLILRDTVPGGNGSAIEVFNVETREVRRLTEGRFSGRPVWNPAQQVVVYLQYDEVRRQGNLIWHPLDARAGQKLASDVVLPIVLVDEGNGAVAYSTGEKALVGRSVDLETEKRRFSFAQYAMRIPTPYEWIYQTAVSPDGNWQVVYNCENFLLVNSQNGTIKQLDLGTEVIEGRPFPRWALDAQWSRDGRQLAIASTFGDFLPRITRLLVLDPWEEKVREIRRPPGIIFSEVDWAPEGRHLLVSGLEAIGEGTFLPRMWLVDVKMGKIRDLDLFPVARSEDPRGGAAWSPDGKHLLFYCRPKSVSGAALCLASAEVE